MIRAEGCNMANWDYFIPILISSSASAIMASSLTAIYNSRANKKLLIEADIRARKKEFLEKKQRCEGISHITQLCVDQISDIYSDLLVFNGDLQSGKKVQTEFLSLLNFTEFSNITIPNFTFYTEKDDQVLDLVRQIKSEISEVQSILKKYTMSAPRKRDKDDIDVICNIMKSVQQDITSLKIETDGAAKYFKNKLEILV